MEEESQSCLKAKKRTQKGNVWVRRSTRGAKELNEWVTDSQLNERKRSSEEVPICTEQFEDKSCGLSKDKEGKQVNDVSVDKVIEKKDDDLTSEVENVTASNRNKKGGRPSKGSINGGQLHTLLSSDKSLEVETCKSEKPFQSFECVNKPEKIKVFRKRGRPSKSIKMAEAAAAKEIDIPAKRKKDSGNQKKTASALQDAMQISSEHCGIKSIEKAETISSNLANTNNSSDLEDEAEMKKNHSNKKSHSRNSKASKSAIQCHKIVSNKILDQPKKKIGKLGRKQKAQENPLKTSLGETHDKSTSGVSVEKGRVIKPKKTQKSENNLTESDKLCVHEKKISKWKDLFASKEFKCINDDCLETFISWISLFGHMHACKSCKELDCFTANAALTCHVCVDNLILKRDFLKHMRLLHRDVYDLVQFLESGNMPKCFNYKCSASIQTYDDCIKHGSQCGSLILCNKCKKSYKTRQYFNNHACIAETGKQSLKLEEKKSRFTADPSGRKAAKRALVAIKSIESGDVAASSKNQLKIDDDDDFEAKSNSSEDSEEYQDIDSEIMESNQDKRKVAQLVDKGTIRNVSASFTGSVRIKSKIERREIKPRKDDIKWLMKWYTKNLSSVVFPEWNLSKEDVEILSNSDAAEYLPSCHVSPLFNVIYETQKQHAYKTEWKQLKTFDTLKLEGSSTMTMFVGGSVLAIEWCPRKEGCDQFLALTTVGDYTQVAEPNTKKKHIIQIWKVPHNPNVDHNDVLLSMNIPIDFGPIYCLKWCPSFPHEESCDIQRLGILALSSDDGCIRILSVIHPSYFQTERAYVTVRHKIALMLMPCRRRVSADWSRVTCMEWQPSKGHKKFAAGYEDGTICIWNLECKSSLLRFSNNQKPFDVLLPFSKIDAHSYYVSSLSWCANDPNFIVSVSFEKHLKIFDIREKNPVPVISIRKYSFEKCLFLTRLSGILTSEDELSNNLPTGSRFLDLIYHTFANLPYNFSDHNIVHNSACLSITYSSWMNAIVTSCSGGEVVFRALVDDFYGDSGKSMRLPVYRIDLSELSSSEAQTIDIDCSVKECIPSDSLIADHQDEKLTVKDVIYKKAKQLPMKIFKHKFTFIDSNFFEFRNKPGKCAVEINQLKYSQKKVQSTFSNDEICQISQVKWNPNYGQHFMLASAGALGLVRIHYFTNWK